MIKIEQIGIKVKGNFAVRYTLALLNYMEVLYSLSCANGFGALPLELLKMKLALSDCN